MMHMKAGEEQSLYGVMDGINIYHLSYFSPL